MSEKNLASKSKLEEERINKIKELCRAPDLKPENWHKYGPKVIYFNIII